VKARALREVLSKPVPQRLPVIAEGLGLLVEHVETLRGTVDRLLKDGDPRGAAILDEVAVEEAAKVLVLLDLVRAGSKQQARAAQTVKHFYDHVARGIYAEVAMMRPADYAEVRRMVEGMRPSHYLDGPNGFDWIFRNPIETRREETFYVDYVKDDEGTRWVSPESNDRFPRWGPSPVINLVSAMRQSGLLSEQGLRLTQQEWQDVAVDDKLRWVDVRDRTVRIIDALGAAGLQEKDLTEAGLARVVEQWSFPLFDLDLRKRPVEQADLDDERKRAEDAFLRDIYGEW
jgi:AbiV family abortive infection protein